MQRSWTTSTSVPRATLAAASERSPSCSHTQPAPIAIASLTIRGASAGGRKTCTTSTGTSISASEARHGSPKISVWRGLTGMTR